MVPEKDGGVHMRSQQLNLMAVLSLVGVCGSALATGQHASPQERDNGLDDLIPGATIFTRADAHRGRQTVSDPGEFFAALVEHYRSMTYWYGLPGASLVLTDELDIGNAGSEKKHAYQSPNRTDRSTFPADRDSRKNLEVSECRRSK